MFLTTFCASVSAAATVMFATTVFAADPSQEKPGDWTVRDFRFHTGEVLPELKLHYVTIGEPTGEPVLVLHGSNGSGQTMLGPNFAGELFGPGQPLDAAKYFLIVPDALGSGKSSKPSNGLRMAFPKFTYEDQVRAQYRLLTEHLGVKHLKLIVGQSMGGMHAWMWGEMYPDFMDALVPIASQPIEISGRNWIQRRIAIEAIRNDPEWNNGNYDKNPTHFAITAPYTAVQTDSVLQIQGQAPTREAGDALYKRLVEEAKKRDANDTLYAIEAVMDYNPTPHLDKIQAKLVAINFADDNTNPPELGVTEREIKRIPKGKYVLVPASDKTHGHFTHLRAVFWKAHLAEFLKELPPQM